MEHNANLTEASLTALNLPAYNAIKIKSWFTQIQSIFNAQQVVSHYCYAVEKLPTKVDEEVADLPETMPK